MVVFTEEFGIIKIRETESRDILGRGNCPRANGIFIALINGNVGAECKIRDVERYGPDEIRRIFRDRTTDKTRNEIGASRVTRRPDE